MAAQIQMDLLAVKALFAGKLFRHAGGGQGLVKEFDDEGALAAPIDGGNPGNAVGNDARLTVGGSCQCNVGACPAEKFSDGHGIADGINVRCRGLHAFIHQNISLPVTGDTGLGGKL